MDLAEEIQVQIDDQIRMREGAMKLMSASSTLNQALETSKNLLTINARILGLMSALQRKKQERVLQEYNRQRRYFIIMRYLYFDQKNCGVFSLKKRFETFKLKHTFFSSSSVSESPNEACSGRIAISGGFFVHFCAKYSCEICKF